VSYPELVRIRTLFVAGLLVAAAFALGSALVTHAGVGVVEYVVGIAAVLLLLFGALRILLPDVADRLRS
jgi:hypothetical protein